MQTTTLQSADWITRDDMAALAGCSVDTVRRSEKALNQQNGRSTSPIDHAGRALVNVGEFLEMGRIRPEDLTLGATPGESAEILRTREVISALKEQVADLGGRLAQADFVCATLSDQLVAKDKQITQQTNLIGQLISRIGGSA